jgi:hypothetical protein
VPAVRACDTTGCTICISTVCAGPGYPSESLATCETSESGQVEKGSIRA